MRDENFSDFLVFDQIFNFLEFEVVLSLIKLNKASNKNSIIIDAGANVGYTTIYFAHYLPFSKIYAIEPSNDNLNILKKNIFYVDKSVEIKLYQNALSEKKGMLYEISKDFRDGLDWSINTVLNEKGNVKGITISEIIEEHNLQYISLLKIDIEGAERFIFNVENDLSFLKMTEIVAIEIHDEYAVREIIYDILRENNYYLIESGELTIAINKKLF